MPKISEFFGIAIYVYWRDHGPPHFHAVYAGDEAAITIEDVPSALRAAASPCDWLGDRVGYTAPRGVTQDMAPGGEPRTAWCD